MWKSCRRCVSPTSMETVLEIFGQKADLSLLPVIDHSGYPRGIIREKDLKSIIYNRFGHALLTNKALGNPQDRFIHKCPIAEISATIDEILEIYAQARNPEGILIVDEFRYLGFLTAQSLLHLVYEKRLEQARDQNPLTKLPGNHSISDHVAACLAARRNQKQISSSILISMISSPSMTITVSARATGRSCFLPRSCSAT